MKKYKNKIIITIVVILVIFLSVKIFVFWNEYPDDSKKIIKLNKKMKSSDNSYYNIVNQYINNGFKIVGSYSPDLKKNIEIMKKSGYLKIDPYSNSPYVYQYSTGSVGKWLDGRKSIALADTTKALFHIYNTGNYKFKFSLCPVSFSNIKKKNIVLLLTNDKNNTFKIVKNVNVYDRLSLKAKSDIEIFSDYDYIHNNTGWTDIELDIDKNKYGNVKSVELFVEDKNKNDLVFIANPLLLKRNEKKHINVVYVVFDAMATQYTDVYSNTGLTPELKKIAEKSIVFNNMISCGVKTRIFLSGFFTSNLPPATGHGANMHAVPDLIKDKFYQDKTIDKMPDYLQNLGYYTVQTGNSGFTHPGISTGVDYGFNESTESQIRPHDSTAIYYNTVKKLKELKDKPFYLYVHFNTTHKPRKVPAKYYVKGTFTHLNKLGWYKHTGSTMYADYLAGQLYSYLKENDFLDNTIVVFTADHGTMYDSKKWAHHFMYNDYIRVPFIMYVPDSLKSQIGKSRIDDYTSVLQFNNTVLDLIGAKPNSKFKYPSIFKNNNVNGINPVFSYDNFGVTAILDNRWKYCLLLQGEKEFRDLKYRYFGDGPLESNEQLYDLQADPNENENVIGFHPVIADKMRKSVLKSNQWPYIYTLKFKVANDSKVVIRHSSNLQLIFENIKSDFTMAGNKIKRTYYMPKSTILEVKMYSNDVNIYIEPEIVGQKNTLIYSGKYQLPLYRKKIVVKEFKELIPSIVFKNDIDLSGLKEKNYVYFSAIDSRRYVFESSNSDEAIDANMKEVLKNWGYIQ